MAQLSPQKRKKRRIQLREAQRRRRARLKEDSKSFLQIILDREILSALRSYSDLAGKPLHTCATELIETGLRIHQKLQSRKQEEPARIPQPPVDLERDDESGHDRPRGRQRAGPCYSAGSVRELLHRHAGHIPIPELAESGA